MKWSGLLGQVLFKVKFVIFEVLMSKLTFPTIKKNP
jgi:hypothetical protein